ncbi:hypothetical protein ACSQ67_024542 [Phaseolus vulgaris]
MCVSLPTHSLSLSLSINILVLFFFFLCSFPILPCTLLKLTSPLICTMSAYKDQDPRLHGIKTKIRVVPNFPKSGIMFQDITTLLLDPKAFKDTIDLFVERYKGKNISVVAGKQKEKKGLEEMDISTLTAAFDMDIKT